MIGIQRPQAGNLCHFYAPVIGQRPSIAMIPSSAIRGPAMTTSMDSELTPVMAQMVPGSEAYQTHKVQIDVKIQERRGAYLNLGGLPGVLFLE